MSRSGDFRGDDDRQTDRQTNQLLYPCACTRGKNLHVASPPGAGEIQSQISDCATSDADSGTTRISVEDSVP